MNRNLVFILFTSAIFWSCSNCEYQIKTYVEPLKFCGVIERKFIDHDNHLFPKVVIVNGSERVIFLPAEKFSGKPFFDYVQEGDSIYKEKGSRIIRTKRLDESKEFVFKCKD